MDGFFKTFSSGSCGNASLLSYKGKNILIDVGISARRLSGFLSNVGMKLADLDGVLVTHKHMDHIYGLERLLKLSGCTIYAPKQVISLYAAQSERFYPLEQADMISLGNVCVTPFDTDHDVDCFGFCFELDGKKFTYATDLGSVTPTVRERVLRSEMLFLESNYDTDMLYSSGYPYFLKTRIDGPNGHLSNRECAQTLLDAVKSGVSRIILGHLSKNTNSLELTKQMVTGSFKEHQPDAWGKFSLEIIPHGFESALYRL